MDKYSDKVRKLLQGKDRMLIGGEWVQAGSGQRFWTDDPATEEKICEVPLAQETDVESAVEAAKGAFAGWRRLDPFERAQRESPSLRAILWRRPSLTGSRCLCA